MKNKMEKLAGIAIPKLYKIIGTRRGAVEVERPDGLRVFVSKHDPAELNRVRLYGDKRTVVLSVGLFRGMQIAENYAEKHAPEIKIKRDIININGENVKYAFIE